MPLPLVLYITTTTTTTTTTTNTTYYHQVINLVNRLIIPGDLRFSQWYC